MQRYISSELTHFIGKGSTEEDQYKIVLKILTEGLLSHAPHVRSLGGNLNLNFNAAFRKNEMVNPEVVCFCDIPLRDLSLHMDKYSRIGLAFEKKFIISKGGRPVMYIPTSSIVRGNKELSPEVMSKFKKENDPYLKGKLLYEEREIGEYFDEMMREFQALTDLRKLPSTVNFTVPDVQEESRRLFDLTIFMGFHIFSFIKFFDPSLADNDPNNFYLEREWRVLGNIDFKPSDIARIILPRKFGDRLRSDFPGYGGQMTFS
jgi:hypothetical protein